MKPEINWSEAPEINVRKPITPEQAERIAKSVERILSGDPIVEISIIFTAAAMNPVSPIFTVKVRQKVAEQIMTDYENNLKRGAYVQAEVNRVLLIDFTQVLIIS